MKGLIRALSHVLPSRHPALALTKFIEKLWHLSLKRVVRFGGRSVPLSDVLQDGSSGIKSAASLALCFKQPVFYESIEIAAC